MPIQIFKVELILGTISLFKRKLVIGTNEAY